MTTPHPGKKAQFYILVPQDATEFTPESTPITFSLPAGTKFPDDLSQIMKKTQGKASPQIINQCLDKLLST